MSVTDDRIFTHDDAQSLLTKQTDIKNSIDALTTAVSNQTTNAVDRSTAQSIDGVKTFTSAPLITDTIPDSENSSKAATTSWVETVFFSKLVAKLAATTATSISSLSTSSLFYRMLSWALTAAGVQYNFTNANAWYICLGALFGSLIIQGGTQAAYSAYWTTVSLPISSDPLAGVGSCWDSATVIGMRTHDGIIDARTSAGSNVAFSYIAITKS